MSYRYWLAFAILAAVPAPAAAQFTTFVPPPVRVDTVVLPVAVDPSRPDTTPAAVADMKTWVDSVVGITPPPMDTVLMVRPRDPVRFADGTLAPATASPLPTLALGGLAALGLGSVLLMGRRERRPRA